MTEKVIHPDHYNWFEIECMSVVKHFNFPLGNAIKYIWRCGRKENESTIQDLEKAKYYIQVEIDRIKTLNNK